MKVVAQNVPPAVGDWVPVRDLVLEPLTTGISRPTKDGADKRCVTLSAIRNGALDVSISKTVDMRDSTAKGNWVRPGAFYVVRGNGNRSLVGRGGFAPAKMVDRVLFPDLLIQLILDASRVDSNYFRFAWDCPRVRADIERRAMTAAGIFKINLRNLNEVLVPLPPMAEQKQTAAKMVSAWGHVATARAAVAAQLDAIDALAMKLLELEFGGPDR